ncbi:XPG domain containing-domain-containing protein [Gamsiella multidivaricata]|uniref:XPG domain containing-domain-containing protein n=1 Tax=Gamsiella multidivaricata TaxID=101098 RepID=UPI0022204317|nr:XPG domain containing-domain-containing protein [Gamsiella multidivaricata]KAG0370480.1 hypothetical protein BGZ54_006132 [Gamsiella multidivaricata]KAI7827064.1 XPG domain containing-domain-containing protein [Gamsiella multidivaricata]
MGVLGLYSYFKSKALGQRKNWTAHPQSTNINDDSSAQQDDEAQRYFILDGNAYIHHLYCGQLEWIWGGQYASFVDLLVAHVTALKACGFHLQFLFDGHLPLQKLQTRLNRDTEKIFKMSRVMGDLEHYHDLGLSHNRANSNNSSILMGTLGGAEAFDKGAGGAGGAGSRSSPHFLIPPLVMEVTLQTLRSLGVDLMVCDGEADGLVAHLAMEKSMNEKVKEAYAISKDSDYFIYNTGSSAKGGYIPLDSLFVSTDPKTQSTQITATVYSQSTIADHLGIRPQFLPLFASLTGNDYLRPDLFEDQIAKALVTFTGQKLSAVPNTNFARIKATAAFLKQYGAGDDAINAVVTGSTGAEQVVEVMERLLKDRKKLYVGETDDKRMELRSALEESMEQYSVITQGEASTNTVVGLLNTATPSKAATAGLHQMKEAIRTGLLSFKLMDVIYNKMFWCTPFLEDMDRESAWLVSRELRRWVYGILARNLLVDSAQEPEEEYESSELDVVEYVRRGSHLSAEIVTAASRLELDEVLKSARAKSSKRTGRRISVMDVDPVEPNIHSNHVDQEDQGKSETMSIDMNLEKETEQVADVLDEASRTSLFLGILGADTAQVRALPQPYMVLAATLRYLINALAHSKTRSASISVANFEVIAFVATVLFLREKYHPEAIPSTSSSRQGTQEQSQHQNSSIPDQILAAVTESPTSIASSQSISLSGSSTLDEAPPLTKRSLHLSAQYQHTLGAVSSLANALYLEDMIPSLASLFDGLLFQQTLALARGGTLLEQRMQYPESVQMYHLILAAVEEDFIDTGEIDVAVVFRAPPGKKGQQHQQQQQQDQRVSLGIFGPDMEAVNQLPVGSPTLSSSSSASGTSWKVAKSAGIHKKSSGSSKKRSGGGSGSGGRNGGRGAGGGANMFNVLSLGCEF